MVKFAGHMINVLYIHGMGGGGDSRIPSILRECFCHSGQNASHSERSEESVSVICRTYDFDPEVAAGQIRSWVKELRPAVVIGESLGALHALCITGVPHLLVSPALNAPFYFEILAWLSLIPGVTWLFDRIYRPKAGDRQRLHFSFDTLRKYLPLRKAALAAVSSSKDNDVFHAFIGTRDHYRKSAIVSLKTWKKHFGETFSLYEGTHFMEDEFIRSMLRENVSKLLNIK